MMMNKIFKIIGSSLLIITFVIETQAQAPICNDCLNQTFVNLNYGGNQNTCVANLCNQGGSGGGQGVAPSCELCLNQAFVVANYGGNEVACFKALCEENIPIDSDSYLLVLMGAMLILVINLRKIKYVVTNLTSRFLHVCNSVL